MSRFAESFKQLAAAPAWLDLSFYLVIHGADMRPEAAALVTSSSPSRHRASELVTQ